MIEKKPRPEALGGVTAKVSTGCGNMYVQMNWHEGSLFEVFATLGNAGGCATCQSEAITRSVTLGLRCGLPVLEYMDQLRGIRCPTPLPFPKAKAVLSCPDAIAKVLAKYGCGTFEDALALIAQGEPNEADDSATQVQELSRQRERESLNG